ncbi:MAG: TonB family protein [Tateyamaria sp.]|uniref:TonB family protein n=1 Tax=Tateyamaria sp. TaxID=1929288 RepID=UPI0032DC913D
MISRSVTVAVIAVLLSLAVHFLGVRVTSTIQQRPKPEPDTAGTSTEIVAPGSAFEDLADPVSEPVTPEPEEVVPPEPAEVPTSDALVASENPQQTTAPDTGTAQSPPSELAEPTAPEPGQTPQPTTVAPVGVDDSAAVEPSLTPPAGTDTVTAIPQGQPVEPSDASPQPPLVSQPTAVPSAPAPVPPVSQIPVVPSVPVVSLQPSDIEPETPVTPIEPEPTQTPEEAIDTEPSELAVTTSLRPRLPAKRPPSAQEGAADGAPENLETRLAPSQLIESPLTAYKRGGANVFGQQGSQTGASRQGFGVSRNSGNSDVTNYVGQVLVHLNRTPSVPVSGKGWARVFFQINPDGSLASVAVLDSSGSRSIEGAAKLQVRSAVPFPRPPSGKRRTLNFIYRID